MLARICEKETLKYCCWKIYVDSSSTEAPRKFKRTVLNNYTYSHNILPLMMYRNI